MSRSRLTAADRVDVNAFAAWWNHRAVAHPGASSVAGYAVDPRLDVLMVRCRRCDWFAWRPGADAVPAALAASLLLDV